jgi:hypothetical protein
VREDGRRSDAPVAAAVGAVALVAYAATLRSTVSFWDTGELETVPYMLGIAHPTASPAFVLLGWLFTHLWAVGPIAHRVDLMCALSVAGCAALAYASLRRLDQPRPLAFVCALGFAFAPIPWRDATRAEVQDVALLFRVLSLFFGLRWASGGREGDLVALAVCAGLACATHGLAVLALPALALLVLARRTSLRPRSFALLTAGFALGLSPYAYLPLRSAYVTAHALDPTRALGLPPGMPFWDYDHPASASGFVRLVSGADFDVPSGFAGFVKLAAYPQFAQAAARRVVASFGTLGALAGLLGVAVVLASRRPEYWAILLAGVLPVPYTESYGALQDPDRYYLLPLWCAAALISLGANALVARVGREPAGALLAGTALAASFCWGVSDRAGILGQSADPGASAYIKEIEDVTPPNAIVVADWAFATPLAYEAYVERGFGGRIVVSASPDQYASSYRSWLALRPLYVVGFSNPPALPGYALERVGIDYNVFRVRADSQAPR